MASDTCRSCLKDGFNMKSLFSRGMICKNILTLRELLISCANLDIERDDGYPQKICEACINIIERSYSFRVMCERNEKILKHQFEPLDSAHFEEINLDKCAENDYCFTEHSGFEYHDDSDNDNDIDPELLRCNVIMLSGDNIIDQFEKIDEIKPDSNQSLSEVKHETNVTEDDIFFNKKETRKNFSCTQCKRQFKLKASLDLHILRNHSDNSISDSAKLICTICNKKCVSEIHYNRHMNYHKTGKQYHCDICGRDFSQHRSYESHKYSHTGERPFLCTECGKRFKQNCDLEIHMRLHLNTYPYVCNICGAKYRYSSIFTLHKRTHSGEKPFECPFCDKKFRNSCRLKVHKRVHTGEKPYPCKLCGKAFARPYALKVHSQTHTGERPHICTICDRGFAQAHCLRSHMKIHERKEIQSQVLESDFNNDSLKLDSKLIIPDVIIS